MNIFHAIILICSIATITSIDISVTPGEKLFNSNTPFVVNLSSPDNSKKNNHVDVAIVVDISKSMAGEKIKMIKDALLHVSRLISGDDQLGIVTFSDIANYDCEMKQCSQMNRKFVDHQIHDITIGKGSNILDGLTLGYNMLKNSKIPNHSSAIFLFSTGLDTNMSNDEIIEGFQKVKKKGNFQITLHTFGFGGNQNTKLLTKLASLHEGFYYNVQNTVMLRRYFGNSYAALSSLSGQNAVLSITSKFPLKKVYGIKQINVNSHEEHKFETRILYLSEGLDNTYVLEVDIPDKNPDGSEIISLRLTYEDIKGKPFTQTEKVLFTEQTRNNLSNELLRKANEEYIRAETYETIQNALDFFEYGKYADLKDLLTKMEQWLASNYKGKNTYLKDIQNSIENYQTSKALFLLDRVSEMLPKRGGSELKFKNGFQIMTLDTIDKTSNSDNTI